MIRLGVTGTDTGIGKTVISAALLLLLRQQGLRVGAMKPVETGHRPGDPEADAVRLQRAAGGGDPLESIRPYSLPDPLAPWIAALATGLTIEPQRLDEHFTALSRGRDGIVVEGAGGLLVPLTRELTFLDLFHRWRLEVVVVAGNRLGALNHTLLTVRALREAGLPIRGVVLNHLGPHSPGAAEQSNLDALAELLEGAPVVAFPWLHDPSDDDEVLGAAEAARLGSLLARGTGMHTFPKSIAFRTNPR